MTLSKSIAFLLLMPLLIPRLSFAAEAAKPGSPAPARRAAPAVLVSPEIRPGGEVVFRFRAPNAQEVKVSGQFGRDTLMQRDEQGVWSATAQSVPAGVHEYRFLVDGVAVIDSQNPAIKPQRWPNTSILHIPAHPPAPWDLTDIPHGTVHEHVYFSKALGTWRRALVYTPPGTSSRRLPTLYLAHGYSDNEGTWTAHGKAHWILDSLIASGKAVPMVVVMPDAHALPPGAGFREDYGVANSGAFCAELVKDLIPLVEQNYRVIRSPGSRAFAGLSMGGHHALTVAMKHHDSFGWVGAFSSAPPPDKEMEAALAQPAAVNRDLKLLWIACGKKDFLFDRNEKFTALLKARGVRHDYAVTEGDHSWPVWRNYLVTFAPKLFR